MGCCGLVSCILGLCLILKFIDWLLRRPKLGLSSKTKNILVTGCDTGFGHLFAKRMDKKGFCVFAGCLTEEGIKTLTEACSSQMNAFQLDVTNEDSVERAVDFVRMTLGEKQGLWAAVNNAGILGTVGQTIWMKRKDYEAVMDVNFHGLRHMCQAFLPLLLESRGRIINTSSVLGRTSSPSLTPYSVSKYAVEAFSDALRMDIHCFGVSVHIIEPGLFNTSIMHTENIVANFTQTWRRQPDGIKKLYGDNYCKKVIEMWKNVVKKHMSSNIGAVADAYEHAVLGVFPRTRYLAGWDARLVYGPLSLLHSWICDKVILQTQVKPHGSVATESLL